MYNQLLIFTVAKFCIVDVSTELVNPENHGSKRKHRGHLWVSEHISGDQYTLLFYVCFCLKTPI